MAMHGVLFLDELPEFDRRVLEVLREPLESGRISVSRAARQAEFPARFQLVAAMNPCPCGYLGHANGRCRCSPGEVARYRGRISGPLLDRIDLQVEVPALLQEELARRAEGETSEAVRRRVAAARARQIERQGKPNVVLSSREVDTLCSPDAQGLTVLKQAIARLGLSARAYHRVLKAARSIADLEGSAKVSAPHIAEAVQYRRFERAP
jgi:magnesium chelatase family protein